MNSCGYTVQRCDTTGDAGEHPVKGGASRLPGEVCLDAREWPQILGISALLSGSVKAVKLCFNHGFKEGAEAAGLEPVSP